MNFITEGEVKELGDKPIVNDKDSFDFYNPPQGFQQAFTGSTFHLAYAEAAIFLNHIFSVIEADRGGSLDFKGMRIVDFGCGWGRMLRLLRYKLELQEAELYGLEQQADAIRLCQKSVPRVWISRTRSFPPSDLRSSFIDVVYAYSVFSHLNVEPHLAWAQEIHRILRPGGYACVTVQPRSFIQFCSEFRNGKREIGNNWHQLLSGAFKDEEDCYRRYDNGEFVFDFTTGGAGLEKDVYGDAVVPQGFVEKHWSRLGFRVVSWSPVPEPIPAQTRAVLQKLP